MLSAKAIIGAVLVVIVFSLALSLAVAWAVVWAANALYPPFPDVSPVTVIATWIIIAIVFRPRVTVRGRE